MGELIYNLDGIYGRHIDVYDDKVVLTVKAGLGSLFTGNISDGEKTIYYVDCIGVQFKKSGFQYGYLQFETASGIMNNRINDFFNENTFTWNTTKQSNETMEAVANYVKSRIDYCKTAKGRPVTQMSPAEELKKCKELLDMGILTQEEFDIKKKQLLDL